MKTRFLFLLMLISGIYTVSAQQFQNAPTGKLQESRIAQCVVRNDLQIICDKDIDLVTLTNSNGRIIFQTVPVNNSISIQSLDTGFYLLEAYAKGKKVKRGIVKKII